MLLKAHVHPRCIARRGTIFIYENPAILRVRNVSIYFHPCFLSLKYYHAFGSILISSCAIWSVFVLV